MKTYENTLNFHKSSANVSKSVTNDNKSVMQTCLLLKKHQSIQDKIDYSPRQLKSISQMRKLSNNYTKNSNCIQRTILSDMNEKDFNEKTKTEYIGATKYFNDYEIIRSANLLHEFYGMDIYSVDQIHRDEVKINKDEPLILVGHGGNGEFMETKNLIDKLRDWGLDKGVRVVLAGCNSALAIEVIKSIRDITSTTLPVANTDLAFTGQTSEVIIDEKDESLKKLQDTHKSFLKKLDFQYVEGLKKNLLDLGGEIINKDNYDSFRDMLNNISINCLKVNAFQNIKVKYGSIKDVEKLNLKWKEVIEKLGVRKVIEELKSINSVHERLSEYENVQIQKIANTYDKNNRELLGRINNLNRNACEEYMQAIESLPSAKKISYARISDSAASQQSVAIEVKKIRSSFMKYIMQRNGLTEIDEIDKSYIEIIDSILLNAKKMVLGSDLGRSLAKPNESVGAFVTVL